LFVGLVFSIPGWASGISYTCAANIETSTCTYLNTNVAGLYAGVFTNANAKIYIQYGNTGLGESQQYYNSVSFNSYLSALTSHEGPGDANDVTTVASLQGGEPSIFGGGSVMLTSALDAALGLSGGIGVDLSLSSCSLANSGCYNGIVTLSSSQPYYYRVGQQSGSQYDIYSVVEHETNEVLGTSSCITNSGGSAVDASWCSSTGVSPADLFRYSASNTRSFVNQANGTLAYFSINNGVTPIAYYNNTPNGEDFGDWSSQCAHVQDAVGCLGQSYDITSDGRVEIVALDAVGYNLVPEPGTPGLLALGFAGVLEYRRRCSRRVS
jgi:hypothetical protein